MPCPNCGFVSFSHLTVCKKCGKPLPAPQGARRPPAPLLPEPPAPPRPSPTAPQRDVGTDTLNAATRARRAPTDTLIEADARPPSDIEAYGLSLPRKDVVPSGGAAPALRQGRPAKTPADARPAGRVFRVRSPGLWVRFAAAAVDTAGLALVWGAVCAIAWPGGLLDLIMAAASLRAAAVVALPSLTLFAVIFLVMWVGYSVGFVAWRGQTPGKILLGLKIVRANGEDMNLLWAYIRWVGCFLSAATLGVGYVVAMFRPDGRALQDLIANTRVTRL